MVFLHLQKTGGSTIHHLLHKHLPSHSFAGRDVSGKIITTPEGSWDEGRIISGHVTARDVRRFQPPPHIFTLLRDPQSRLLSHYYFLKSYTADHLRTFCNPLLDQLKQISLAEFLSEKAMAAAFRDYYVRRLDPEFDIATNGPSPPDLGRALKFLESCDLVGIMPRLEAFAREAMCRLGIGEPGEIPVINRRESLVTQPGFEPVTIETITPPLRLALEEWTRDDWPLYELATRMAP